VLIRTEEGKADSPIPLQALLRCTEHPSGNEYGFLSVHDVAYVGLVTCHYGIDRAPHARHGNARRGIRCIWARRVWSAGR
jgi:hypothetical protein